MSKEHSSQSNLRATSLQELVVKSSIDLLQKSKFLPLIPPYQRGKNLKFFSFLLAREGLGRGHSWFLARGLMLQRSYPTLWHDLGEIDQQSLSGGFNTQGDVDRPIISDQIRSSQGFIDSDSMVHELGHAHGRGHGQPVIISWTVDFNAME